MVFLGCIMRRKMTITCYKREKEEIIERLKRESP